MGEQVKVDFKVLKNSVPIAAVLERYGVVFRHSGEQLSVNCPLPTHSRAKSCETGLSSCGNLGNPI